MADRERRKLLFAHQEWLGFVQPVGLVVSPPVMVDAQVVPDRNIAGRQLEFRELLDEHKSKGAVRYRAPSLRHVFVDFLGWEDSDLVDAADHREELEIALPELRAVLSTTWAVPHDGDTGNGWMMLVHIERGKADLDRPPPSAEWNASRQARFERLLRETGVPTGLLCTDERVRLVYAPKGESSGHITFEFSQMAQPAGRPILAAFDMLLSGDALFGPAPEARLPTLLAKSRDAQAEVSTKLSRQVLAALHELLRGFVAADTHGEGKTAALARSDPQHLYGGLITTLMRLVFVLYAEDRGLMPDHRVYQQHYSLGGLFARLRADAAAWPDTMDQRFGAWSQLLSLFRLIHSGGKHAGLSFVARKGKLFDPKRFPFLEGSKRDGNPEVPMIPDSTIWKVLKSLIVLDGERLSYRTLDVEQIGSVYEAVMGFRIELTTGHSIAVASQKRTGAAVITNLNRLLAIEGGKRAIALRDTTDRKLTGNALSALRKASTISDLVSALDRVIDRDATPEAVPAGTPVLQPTDERRRSGSHYTPRSLTQPIVAEALRPIFERLGPQAHPDAILNLKVCDPATGSGAFLVEACRQLSERLVKAWNVHGGPTGLPADQDELLHARRLVAQQCLYGVDRNPMAIDLARLSLWLITLARDHEFTFVDHALRQGDSLVGLSLDQIRGFHWDANKPNFQFGTETIEVQTHVDKVMELREIIRELGDETPEHELRDILSEIDRETQGLRTLADLLISAFFRGGGGKERECNRLDYANRILDSGLIAGVSESTESPPVSPFHWGLEFPEVFASKDSGFDVIVGTSVIQRKKLGFDTIVGNPPFAGKNTVAAANPEGYTDWLKQAHSQSHGNSDLAAHFFRRAFNLLRDGGTFGLIATNTIGQGDTRSTGLRWICEHSGELYGARRRLKWPGEAAVVVSVLHGAKGPYSGPRLLDRKHVDSITAFLFHTGSHHDPERLRANTGRSFQGSIILGMGFTFDDRDSKGVATPLEEMDRLIEQNPRNREPIFPYIGGEEVNTEPTHSHHRYVINFRDWPLHRVDLGTTWKEGNKEVRKDWIRSGIVPLDYPDSVANDWPNLLAIVQDKVRPQRELLPPKNSINRDAARLWWRFLAYRQGLNAAIEGLDRVLVVNCGATAHTAFTFLPAKMVFANSLVVFPFNTTSAFCLLQSRFHEVWARFFGSSMKDDLRYTPSDCFETFPFPEDWETTASLESTGKDYYDFRAKLMVENNEGMTKTYNRFHDPDERDPRIERLRQLHAEMDRAVLDAYGWKDVSTDCEFLLDYEIDEETWGKKKKPWRYRWPDEVHDKVLAHLLDLNAERADEERADGSGACRQKRQPR